MYTYSQRNKIQSWYYYLRINNTEVKALREVASFIPKSQRGSQKNMSLSKVSTSIDGSINPDTHIKGCAKPPILELLVILQSFDTFYWRVSHVDTVSLPGSSGNFIRWHLSLKLRHRSDTVWNSWSRSKYVSIKLH